MISRLIVIALAFGAGAYRASQGALVEAAGLVALGGGLLALRVAANRPGLRKVAYLCFGIAAASVAYVILRDYL